MLTHASKLLTIVTNEMYINTLCLIYESACVMIFGIIVASMRINCLSLR